MSGQNGMSPVSPSGSASGAGNGQHLNGNSKANNGADKPRLSENEKKQNHIESEKKRRKAIRRGFDRLASILPDFDGDGKSEAKVLQATVDEMLRQTELKNKIYAKLSKRADFTEADFQRFYNTGKMTAERASRLQASKSASPTGSRGGRRRSSTSAGPGSGRGRRRSSATVAPVAGGRRRSSKTVTPAPPVPTPATPNGARTPSAYAEHIEALRLSNAHRLSTAHATELANAEESRRRSVTAGSTGPGGFAYVTPGANNMPVNLPYGQPFNVDNTFNSQVVPAYPTAGFGLTQGAGPNQVKRESPQSSSDEQAGKRDN